MPDEWTQVIRNKPLSDVRKSLLRINLRNARSGKPHVNVIGAVNDAVVIGCVCLDSVKAAKEEICQS